jgi:hypothetical protein
MGCPGPCIDWFQSWAHGPHGRTITRDIPLLSHFPSSHVRMGCPIHDNMSQTVRGPVSKKNITLPLYCSTALLPYCPTTLLPYCPTALLSHCLKMVTMNVCILNIYSMGYFIVELYFTAPFTRASKMYIRRNIPSCVRASHLCKMGHPILCQSVPFM